MPYSFRLSEFGATFATRDRGLELRESLVERASGQTDVTIDLEGVLSVSYSFADEFAASLAADSADGTVPFSVEIVGASPEVERVIERAIDLRRSLTAELPRTG